MSLARISVIEDAIGDRIVAWWLPVAPDEVLLPNDFDIAQSDMTGRKVVIFCDGYSGTPVTRGEDGNDYRFMIWVVERYADPADPPKSWVQDRMKFTERLVYLLGDPRRPYLLAGTPAGFEGYWPQEAVVEGVYDTADLKELKVFVSAISLVLRGDEAPVDPAIP